MLYQRLPVCLLWPQSSQFCRLQFDWLSVLLCICTSMPAFPVAKQTFEHQNTMSCLKQFIIIGLFCTSLQEWRHSWESSSLKPVSQLLAHLHCDWLVEITLLHCISSSEVEAGKNSETTILWSSSVDKYYII